jgi:hypothetical protein
VQSRVCDIKKMRCTGRERERGGCEEKSEAAERIWGSTAVVFKLTAHTHSHLTDTEGTESLRCELK